ncbi:MAG: L-threonylcarbamoyladenylate synthase [Spirochaetes bacterium]|jgi:tRNA threonylcarbamoyl adenosine modification protein (Sua5/YciO/YrdC/YwlC family)|nr:L-threonylcarbamoyladenylate synthase [Spirochaetota bacterium]
MIYHIHEETPHKRHIKQTVDILRSGGIIIYPTDTVYSFGCDFANRDSISRINRITNRDPKKPLSIILSDLSDMHMYVKHVSNEAFKIIKRSTPGPFTFIFEASKEIPKLLLTKQKTIGIRIPDNNFLRELISEYGQPIISTSVDTEPGDYMIDPVFLEEKHRKSVDLVLDAGLKNSELSTMIDFSDGEPVILRQGKGIINF